MLVYQVVAGSRLYGLETPESDEDIGEVHKESLHDIFGIHRTEQMTQKIDDQDQQRHWLSKFCKLAAAGNPNVLEWLFVPEDKIKFVDPVFKDTILKNRHLFLVKDALIASHLGYSKTQGIRAFQRQHGLGAKRAALYDKYGYDVKFFSHSIRLLYQLGMLLHEGEVIYPYYKVSRGIMMECKSGKYSINEARRFIEEEMKNTKEFINKVKLHPNIQTKVDNEAIAELIMANHGIEMKR